MKTKECKSIDDLPELCDMADVEAILPVSRATAYRMAQRGEIPCLRMGNRIIFSREHLKRWVNQKITGGMMEDGQTC